jgi:hypothetical protein
MADPVHRFIQTNGTRIRIAEQGSGKPLLLRHGFRSNSCSRPTPSLNRHKTVIGLQRRATNGT